jgi:hypothetical protein
MKRIDFDTTYEQELAPERLGLCSMAVVLGATLFVLALFSGVASAGEYAPCDKVKAGRSGQIYAFKDDC